MSVSCRALGVLAFAVSLLTGTFAAADEIVPHLWINGSEAPVDIPLGVTAKVSWRAPTSFPEGSCVVYSGHTNGPADIIFNGSGSPVGPEQETGALFRKTHYILSCIDGQRKATAEASVNPSVAMMLSMYPFATISSLLFYAVILLLLVPWSRRNLFSHLAHPIAPHQKHLGGFDAFRGFAATLVAIGHCWWATYPVFAATQATMIKFIAYDSKAVPIFAILSGFLIYRSVLSIRDLDGLRKYAVRRFFRIYPVYALGVLMCILTGQYVSAANHSAAAMLISDLFMFPVISWPGGFANPPTWSLFVEVMFYVLLPIVVLTIGRRRMMPFCIVGIIAMLAADYDSRVFGLWKFFLAGIIASELSLKINSRPLALTLFAAGAGLLYYDIDAPTYGAHDWFADFGLTHRHGDGETIGLGIGCSLLLMTLAHLPEIGRALSILPLRLLGTISYSVYVTHFFYILLCFPKLELFSNAGHPQATTYFETLQRMPDWYLPLVFFPGVLFWGLISYLLVERPGIQLGSWVLDRKNSIAAHPIGSIPAYADTSTPLVP